MPLNDYLLLLFKWLKEGGEKPPVTLIVYCIAHVMHVVAKDAFTFIPNGDVRQYFLFAAALFLREKTLLAAERRLFMMCVVFGTKLSSSVVETILATLCEDIRNQETSNALQGPAVEMSQAEELSAEEEEVSGKLLLVAFV